MTVDVHRLVGLTPLLVCDIPGERPECVLLYGDLGEGNFVPPYTMNNILVDCWEPKEDDAHEMRDYEVGFYTNFDSCEPLENFDNPITGQRVWIHHFRLGPAPRACTPDGVIVMGFKPNLLPIEVIGERVFLATQSIESAPDMARAGQTNHVNSSWRCRPR